MWPETVPVHRRWPCGLAPSRKDTGWSLYCKKYWTWPILWCTVTIHGHHRALLNPGNPSSEQDGGDSLFLFLNWINLVIPLCCCSNVCISKDTTLNPLKHEDQPGIFSVVEVPRRRMAHHFAPIRWLFQHGLVPELRWHGQQTQRGKEVIGFPEHPIGIPALER